EILYQLGIDSPDLNKTDILHALNDKVYENIKKDKDTIIIIDEAHLIKETEIYEELRLLLNFQLNNRFLITLILLGQPELKERINSIPQFEQRISVRYHIYPFDFNEMVRYIAFRIKKAGMNKFVFSKEALKKIYEYSGGVPRKINNICDLSLLVASSKRASIVDSKTVAELIDERK
ncbi:MAG: AAA family ATPase, partial [Deltaproteobacteria bacterium]|nr:AAA family ATPase [Deltaproteobacteria bacterium]